MWCVCVGGGGVAGVILLLTTFIHLLITRCGGKSFMNNILSTFLFIIGARCSSVVRAFTHVAMGCQIDPSSVDPLSCFSFQPVLHEWCNKGWCICYPVCGMMLLIRKSHPFGFLPLYLSVPFTICPTPYNRK